MYWRLLVILLVSVSCANIKEFKGGPVDKQAPRVIINKSSPNNQLHYYPRSIELSFDEWVSLQNPSQNIIISPSLEFPPKYKLVGKKLVISFDSKEKLQDNTTYTVFLGSAIQDITERNVASSVKYVFSTGSFIDSMRLSGIVQDPLSKSPKDKVLVTLYDDLSDTAFTNKKPRYFTYTNKEGQFKFENLKAGDYRLYSLMDNNLNYYFDQKSESYAFHPDIIHVDSMAYRQTIILQHTIELLPLKIVNKIQKNGLSKILFNHLPNDISVYSIPNGEAIPYSYAADTVLLYNIYPDTVQVQLKTEETIDTLQLIPISNYRNKTYKLSCISTRLKPNENPLFTVLVPIKKINAQSIYAEPKAKLLHWVVDSTDYRKSTLQLEPKSQNYKIVFDSAAIVLLDSSYNMKDTFNIEFLDAARFSSIDLTIDSLESNTDYILHLVKDKSIMERQYFRTNSTQHNIQLEYILPGKYDLRLIQDKNNNKTWDGGNFKNKTLPEKVMLWQIGELRADWKLKLELK